MSAPERAPLTALSLGEALRDPRSGITTLQGIDGSHRDASPGLYAEIWVRRLGRRLALRLRTAGGLALVRRAASRRALALAIAATFVAASTALYLGPAQLAGAPRLQTALLYDRTGRFLGEIRAEENRVVIPIDEVPRHVQDAFVAAEDQRFWSHPGIDPFAIGRAAIANVMGRRQGGSTITQQYVKNTFVGNERTLWRKIREAVIALRLDRAHSKREILSAYLNAIYLGEGAYGIEAAARTYFGRPARRLTLAEGALLAGVTAAPSRYSPRRAPELARARRDMILDRMAALGFVDEAKVAEAKEEPVRVRRARDRRVLAPSFTDWVHDEVSARLAEGALYRSGLRVRTTLDLDVQRAAEQAVEALVGDAGDPQAAVVALDVRTGAVRAMVGGRDRRPGDFNYATHARRQAGSAFKPFVLAAALEEGRRGLRSGYRGPGTMTVRVRGFEPWRVHNYSRRGYGWMSLKSATAFSVNTVYAQLVRDVGPRDVAKVAERLGIRSRLSAVPSIALGTSGVTVLEMARAYAPFANGGRTVVPTGVRSLRDAEGEGVRLAAREKRRRAVERDTARDVMEALRAVVAYGTATRARVPGATVAGKTGTTQNHRDAWFVGIARHHVVAVWVGHSSGSKRMRDRIVGGSIPAEIFRRTMTALVRADAERADGAEEQQDEGGETRRSRWSPSGDDGGATGSGEPDPGDGGEPGEPSPGDEPEPEPKPEPEPSGGIIDGIVSSGGG